MIKEKIRNSYTYFRHKLRILLKDKMLYKELERNKKFKNCHRGKRCFILGNGPSLLEQDLSVLRDEYVFTVNQISRNSQFESLNSNYHFWADGAFFNISPDKPEDMELLEQFKTIKTKNNNPKCFLPSEAIPFVQRFKLDQVLDISYYHYALRFYDDYNKKVDYSDIIPGFYTVVQWAIFMAIYMGFQEIYLLGCDTTGIINSIETRLNSNVTYYAYDITENEKVRMERLCKERTIEGEFFTLGHVLHYYSEINKYCTKKGIKLVNCSKKSIIDSIPKMCLEEVLLK